MNPVLIGQLRIFARDRTIRDFAKSREKLPGRWAKNSRIKELRSDLVCFAKTSKARDTVGQIEWA